MFTTSSAFTFLPVMAGGYLYLLPSGAKAEKCLETSPPPWFHSLQYHSFTDFEMKPGLLSVEYSLQSVLKLFGKSQDLFFLKSGKMADRAVCVCLFALAPPVGEMWWSHRRHYL